VNYRGTIGFDTLPYDSNIPMGFASMALLVSQLGPQGRAGHAGRGAVRPGTLGHGTVEMPADLPWSPW